MINNSFSTLYTVIITLLFIAAFDFAIQSFRFCKISLFGKVSKDLVFVVVGILGSICGRYPGFWEIFFALLIGLKEVKIGSLCKETGEIDDLNLLVYKIYIQVRFHRYFLMMSFSDIVLLSII